MQPLCSRRARRGHGFCIQSLTGPEKPQRCRGEEGTLRALSRGGRKELCQESRERSPSLGKLDESSRRGRQHSPRRSQTFLSRLGGGRGGPLTAAMVPHRSTARAGASLCREEEPDRAAAWAPQRCYTATIIPRPHKSPRSRHPTPLPQLGTTGAAIGTGTGQGGAPAPRRPGSCRVLASLCRRLPRIPARAEMGHGELLNSAIGRAKARQTPARESGDRPAWGKGRGAKARGG